MDRSARILLMVMAGLLAVVVPRGTADPGPETPAAEIAAEQAVEPQGMDFIDVVRQSGAMGLVLWLALLAVSVAGVWLAIDSGLQIQEKKIVPASLVDRVREAMEQGDLMKALEECDKEPGPLANILSAGFSNVEEGFEVVQEVVTISAELESERLMQRVAYLNLVGNLAPMLGLLGTVQGMIFAFKNLALGSGAASTGVLALNISQALFTTAAGLSIAVPAVGLYYFFRNRATNIILGMEGLTLDLIKVLRNVEIVEEDES